MPRAAISACTPRSSRPPRPSGCCRSWRRSEFVGAHVGPLRGPPRPLRHHPRLCQVGAAQGRRDRAAQPRHRDSTSAPDGTWDVVTEQGTVHAEHVVNCGGLWAREIGRMVGLELPVLAMEHMYLLTEDMPEVAELNRATGKEMITALDFEGEIYMRQERGGMLLGTYEQACKPWSEQADALGLRPGPPASPTSTASRRSSRSASAISRPSSRPASARSSTGPSPSRRTATRWSGRSRACATTGSPAASWPASARAAASASLSRTGWSTAIPASTSGAWTSPATATGRRSATPTPRCARTMRGASASASPTRSCRRPAPSAPRRSTTASPSATPCSATCAASSTRSGSRRRQAEAKDDSPSAAPTISPMSAPSAARCARASASWRSRTSPNTRWPGRAPRPGSTTSCRTACRGSGAWC